MSYIEETGTSLLLTQSVSSLEPTQWSGMGSGMGSEMGSACSKTVETAVTTVDSGLWYTHCMECIWSRYPPSRTSHRPTATLHSSTLSCMWREHQQRHSRDKGTPLIKIPKMRTLLGHITNQDTSIIRTPPPSRQLTNQDTFLCPRCRD